MSEASATLMILRTFFPIPFYILVEISISEYNLTYRFLRTERTTNQTCMQRVVNRP